MLGRFDGNFDRLEAPLLEDGEQLYALGREWGGKQESVDADSHKCWRRETSSSGMGVKRKSRRHSQLFDWRVSISDIASPSISLQETEPSSVSRCTKALQTGQISS
jgi:hypothetical protein